MRKVKLIDFSAAMKRHSGDITKLYKTVDGEPVCLSYFFPADYAPQAKKYPVFFFVHGGGWGSRKVFGDQTAWAGDYLGFLARYYADRGFVSVSIDYRLLRENGQSDGRQLIDLYEDCMDALCFVADEASALGLNTENAAVLGESAGGYLAAAMATFPYRKNPFMFRLAVLVNAITALNDGWGKAIPAESAHPLLKGLTYEEKYRVLSPACQVSVGTCPTLLLHGEGDTVVSPRHAFDFQSAMARAGNEADILWLPETKHAFLLVEYSGNVAAASAAVHRIDDETESRGLLSR